MNGLPVAAVASICAGSGSMNRLTSMPAWPSAAAASVMASAWLTTFSPPSVVTSARFSGTRQTASGLRRRAMSIISGVVAISKLRRVVTASRMAQMSRSRMCRRSSRRWAVMPCAPAASACRTASTGHGSPWSRPRYRACRSVATWSMLTPSLSIGFGALLFVRRFRGLLRLGRALFLRGRRPLERRRGETGVVDPAG